MTEEDFKKYETSYRQYYGENYDKALNNLRATKNRLKDEFEKKYPNAHVSRFSFNVILSKTGDVTGTSTSFKVCEGLFLDITTEDFKKLYSGELYWSPRIWDTSGTVQPFNKNSSDLNVNSFKIYVTNNLYFDVTLPAFDIKNNKTSNDYINSPYLAALFSAYITTYSCGISMEHFTSSNNIISSIARYHLYFHMKRFIRQPNKISRYITQEMKKLIMDNKPTVYK